MSNLKDLPNNRYLNTRPVSAKIRDSSQSALSNKTSKVLPSFRPTIQSTSDFKHIISQNIKSSKFTQNRLYEENLSIKIQSNSLSEENTKLRTKISQIEKSLKHPDEVPENSCLLARLKNTAKDLKQQLRKKEKKIEKLKKIKKNTQIAEIKVEIKTYIDECTRLRHHLEEVMRQKNIGFETLEFEEKLFRLNLDIESLRTENFNYSENLAGVREETIKAKEKIAELENGSKTKKSLKKLMKKLVKIQSEISEIKAKTEFDKQFYENADEQLVEDTNNLQKVNEGITKKLISSELRLQEQNIILEQLKTEELSREKNNFRRAQTIVLTSKTQGNNKKMRNPPKLFQKIFNISIKKNLMVDVLFSLLDENSNWVIDIDEICKGLKGHGCKIKEKYIVEAFKIMGIEGNSVSVAALHEFYNNYEYTFVEVESSSEEIVEKPKIVVERLTYNQVTPNLPEGANDGYNLKKSDLVQAIEYFAIISTINEIQIKMQKLGLKKSKLLITLFGESLNSDKPHTVFSLTDLILKSPLELANKADVTNFSKYLIQPDGLTEYSPSILINPKLTLSDISKKLISLFDEWPVYAEGRFYHVIEGLKDLISAQTLLFMDRCQRLDKSASGKIKIEEFKSICHELEMDIDPDSWEIIKIELYPERNIRYQDFCILKLT